MRIDWKSITSSFTTYWMGWGRGTGFAKTQTYTEA